MTRRFRRILLTIAVLPLVLLIGLRSAWAAYACSVDGEVRSSCCCPKKESKDDESSRDGVPRIAASCCCDITTGESSVPPDARLADSSRPDDVPWFAVGVVPAPVDVAQRIVAMERIGFARPPPYSVPTYLFNRTFLL